MLITLTFYRDMRERRQRKGACEPLGLHVRSRQLCSRCRCALSLLCGPRSLEGLEGGRRGADERFMQGRCGVGSPRLLSRGKLRIRRGAKEIPGLERN